MNVTIENPRGLISYYIYEEGELDPVVNRRFKDYQNAYHFAVEQGWTVISCSADSES